VQSIKAGIMEIADIFVLNKADREGVERLEREVKSIAVHGPACGRLGPPVVKTVASEGRGIAELVAPFWITNTF